MPLLNAPPAKKDSAEGESIAATTAVLLAAIDSPGGDAFDLVTDYLQHADAKTTALVDEVFDRVATRAGYAAASKWRLDTIARADEQLAATERMDLPSAAAALTPAMTAARTDAISPAVARLLNRAPLVPFVECAVDDNARSAEPGVLSGLPGRAEFLPSMDVLRIETRGDEIVALASSQDVDPTGDFSAGGYWIVRSTDRGATWNPPLYTGLRVAQPYEASSGRRCRCCATTACASSVTMTDSDGQVEGGNRDRSQMARSRTRFRSRRPDGSDGGAHPHRSEQRTRTATVCRTAPIRCRRSRSGNRPATPRQSWPQRSRSTTVPASPKTDPVTKSAR